jgi:hypothetical protein
MRRKSGRQTENSVLSLWTVSWGLCYYIYLLTALSPLSSTQRWLPTALADGLVPDAIVDAHHTIEYLKYAATRNLLTTKGNSKDSQERLSAVRTMPVPAHRPPPEHSAGVVEEDHDDAGPRAPTPNGRQPVD